MLSSSTLPFTATALRDAVKTIHYGISTVRFQKAGAGMHMYIAITNLSYIVITNCKNID